jgi:hypothetical protein
MLRLLVGLFDKVVFFIACALVVALLGVVMLGVITRTVGDPLIWTDELSRFLMVWLAVFGWILASRKRIHASGISISVACSVSRGRVASSWRRRSSAPSPSGTAGLVAKNIDLEATSLLLRWGCTCRWCWPAWHRAVGAREASWCVGAIPEHETRR